MLKERPLKCNRRRGECRDRTPTWHNLQQRAGGCSLAAATWLNNRQSAEMYAQGPSLDSLGTQLPSVDEFLQEDRELLFHPDAGSGSARQVGLWFRA